MKYDFLISGSGDPSTKDFHFYHKLAKEFSKRGFKVCIIPTTLVPPANVNLRDYEEENIKYYTMGKLKENYEISFSKYVVDRIKKEYSIPSIKSFYFSDYIYTLGRRGIKDFYTASNNCELDELYKKTIETFQILEQFLKENEISYIVQYMGASILNRVLYHVGSKKGIPNIYMSYTPIKNHFVLVSNEFSQWDELNIKPYNEVTNEEINEAKSFINKFRREKRMLIHNRKRNAIDEILFRHRLNNEKNPIKILGTIKWVLEDRIKMSDYERYYRPVNYDDKFMFFPLHYHCESRLTLRDPHCWRQEFVAEYVARSLPQGYKLYVKPHPEWVISFPLEGIRLLSKVHNIVLIHPEINSHELIQKSKAMVTINSTTGFEAILYGKPVVCFGNSFYSRLGLTVDISDFREVPEALNKAINSKINEKDIIRYVSAVLHASHPGVYSITNLDDENIKLIVDGYLDYIRTRYGRIFR